jgi:hypothetical protein
MAPDSLEVYSTYLTLILLWGIEGGEGRVQVKGPLWTGWTLVPSLPVCPLILPLVLGGQLRPVAIGGL